MILKYIVFFTFLVVSFAESFAQDRKVVQGKVISKVRDLEGIYIENISARKRTTTEKGGYFKIEMQPNVTLIFASINLKAIRKIVKDSDFTKSLLFVPMEMSEYNLDEMVIDKRITTESLGLAPKKKYTPAEKRLFTATSSSGGIIPIDAIINGLSGRTAMLKQALDYERDEILMTRIINIFDETYYTDQLHIPKAYINGFGYYLIQDQLIVAAFNSKNKDELKFLMSQKAVMYNQLIKNLK